MLSWRIVFTAFLLLVNIPSYAIDFSTNFEGTVVTSVSDFSISNNGVSAHFSGGTNFTIGNFALYHSGTKSWMIDPEGTHGSRGTSTGTGTMTFSDNPVEIVFFIRTQNTTNPTLATVRILDSTDAVVHEASNIGHASWSTLSYSIVNGEAEIARVEVSVTGGGMVAVDDLSFSTAFESEDAATNDGSDSTDSGADNDTDSDTDSTTPASESGSAESSSSSSGPLKGLWLFLLGFFAAKRNIRHFTQNV